VDGELIFSILFLILALVGRGIRGYYSLKGQTPGKKRSVRERWKEATRVEGTARVILLMVNGVFLLIAIVLYLLSPQWMLWSQFPIHDWARWIGVGLGVLSLPFQIWVHRTLAKHWSSFLKLQEGHSLVTTGPYRWVRHPMYTQSLMFFIALTLVSANLLILIGFLIAFIFTFTRIPKEEQMLLERFGDEYRLYMKRTGRLLPRLRRQEDKVI